MKLNPRAFEMVKSGTKTIEVRLWDEKRQLLKVGDEVEFANNEDASQTFKAKVIDLMQFKTFSEIYGAYPAGDFGGETKEELEQNIYKYYTKEDEAKYGVVGIKLELI
ncbi:MAG TPA: ASCH domain-containing protein [Candidatus Paceibacterota bacterium]